MPMTRLKARLDILIWVLIFGGMFAIVFGIASRPAAPASGWSLIGAGAIACAAGALLVWVRSRMGPDN